MQYLNAAHLFPRRDGRRQRRGQLDDGFQGAALALGHQAVSGAFVVQRDCRRRAVLYDGKALTTRAMPQALQSLAQLYGVQALLVVPQ